MRLLLHCCCGPCATGVATYFADRGDAVTGWFYNPNIQPEEERVRRRETFGQAARALGLTSRPAEEGPDFVGFLRALAAGRGRRCRACYRMRLEPVAQAAATEGYEAFATTLVISPYQDQRALAAVGEEVGARWGVAFQAADLRDRYPASRARARELGLYLQNYCGCLFSKLERAVRRAERAAAAALAHGPQG